jgi:hypothetical protein
MKLIILPIIAMLFLLTANGQCPLKLTELQKICGLNSDESNNYILNKGYAVDSSIDKGDFNRKIYFCKKDSAKRDKDQVIIMSKKDKKAIINLVTYNEKIYQNIKKELLIKKYKFQKKEDFPIGNLSTTYYYYTNGNFEVSYFSYYIKEYVKWQYVIAIRKL